MTAKLGPSIGHVGIYVQDLERSDAFYRPLLKAIGFEVIFQTPQFIVYGADGKPHFEIYVGKPRTSPLHIAFHVGSEEEVVAFHRLALELGAQDNGCPGIRKYPGIPPFYASFIIDPINENNLEACCETLADE